MKSIKKTTFIALLIFSSITQAEGANYNWNGSVKNNANNIVLEVSKFTAPPSHVFDNSDNVVSTNNSFAIQTNNYTGSDENLVLTQLENYINNTSMLINKAKALQNPNERYQFNYQALTQDLKEIANSVNRFVNQNKSSQTPRVITPLTKRY